jgi:hypothetical protein
MRQINTDNFVEPSDEGVLGLDEATALLAGAEQEDADPGDEGEGEDSEDEADDGADDSDDVDASADDEDSASDQEASDEDAPEEDPASEDDAEDEDDAPAEPVSDPPKFWSAEEKALFAKAPAELQQVISARDAEYSRQVSLAKEEAATARKEASVITDVKSAIDKQLERAETVFKGKWDGVDWAQWAKDDVAEYAAAKEEFEAEQRELEALRTSQEATAREEHRQFVKAESARLAELVPVFADPAKGPEIKRSVAEMLREDGFPVEAIQAAGALELRLAYEALQWRQAQKRLAQKPQPKPEPAKVEKKAPGVVKPVAAAPPRKAIVQRKTQEVVSRAHKTGRMDDAVAALMALERA